MPVYNILKRLSLLSARYDSSSLKPTVRLPTVVQVMNRGRARQSHNTLSGMMIYIEKYYLQPLTAYTCGLARLQKLSGSAIAYWYQTLKAERVSPSQASRLPSLEL
jgi:hypothetical protein